MTLTFAPSLPVDYQKAPIVISGEASLFHPAREYVLGCEGEECVAAGENRLTLLMEPPATMINIGCVLIISRLRRMRTCALFAQVQTH